MAVDAPGVDVVLLVNLVALALAVGLAWAWVTGRLPPEDRRDDHSRHGDASTSTGPFEDGARAWREEAARLAGEVRAAAAAEEGAVVDRDSLARQLVPLSATLKGHAREAPAEVDEETVSALFALSDTCYELGMEYSPSAEARTGVFLEDRLDQLCADAAALEGRLRKS